MSILSFFLSFNRLTILIQAMFVRLLKANNIYNLILFPLVGILLLAYSFFYGENFFITIPKENHLQFLPISVFSIQYKWTVALNLIPLIIICLQLLSLNSKFAFSNERTFLPVYLFMFLVYTMSELHVFQPIFISTIFIIWSIYNIFSAYEKRSALANSFNAGLMIGLAGIFCFYLNFLVLTIPMALFIIRGKIEWREMVLPFIGMFLPWIFVLTGYYLTDNFDVFVNIFTSNFTIHHLNFFTQIPIIIYLTYLSLLIFLASIHIIGRYGIMNIGTRRYFKVFVLLFSLLFLLIVLPFTQCNILVIMAIPVSFLLTNFFLYLRKRFWAELFLAILIVFAFTLQFFR